MSTKTKEENARKQSDRRPRIRGAGRDREMQAAECCASGDGASRLCQLSDAKTRAVNVENSVRSGRQRDGLEAVQLRSSHGNLHWQGPVRQPHNRPVEPPQVSPPHQRKCHPAPDEPVVCAFHQRVRQEADASSMRSSSNGPPLVLKELLCGILLPRTR